MGIVQKVAGLGIAVATVLLLPAAALAQDDRYIVQFNAGSSGEQIASAIAQTGGTQVDRLDFADGSIAVLVEGATAASAEALEGDANVEAAEPDGTTSADLIPTDAQYSDQWALQQINASQAWDLTLGESTTVVAVVDSGVDASHPEMAGRVLPGYDAVLGVPGAPDVSGHGTQIAGVIAAGADGAGMVGVAPGVSVLPVRVLNASNTGFFWDLASGITWATNNGADVINLSVSSYEYSVAVRTAVDAATQAGIVVTCSAGNDGFSQLAYPALDSTCISVGGTNQSDALASFSNYGIGLEMVAPAVDILATTQGGGTTTASGTSLAVPMVSGAAALAHSLGADRALIEQMLFSTSADLGAAGYDTTFGHGRLDVGGAVGAVADELGIGADEIAPSVSIELGDVVRRQVGTRTVKRMRLVERGEWRTKRQLSSRFDGVRRHWSMKRTSRNGNVRVKFMLRVRNGELQVRKIVWKKQSVKVPVRRKFREVIVNASDNDTLASMQFDADHRRRADVSESRTLSGASASETFHVRCYGRWSLSAEVADASGNVGTAAREVRGVCRASTN